MRINFGFMAITVSVIFAFSSGTSLSDVPIAEVVRADNRVTIEIEDNGSAEPLSIIQGKDPAKPVSHNQLLTAGTPPGSNTDYVNGFLRMDLKDGDNTLLKVRNGSIKFRENGGNTICDVTGIALFSTRDSNKESLLKACGVEAGDFFFRHLSTEFLIDARGVETSLFVMEGAVEVSNLNPEFKDEKNVVVNAGEWLVTRNGESIPQPKTYRRTDPVSGNSECIYSWCRITRAVINEPPYRSILIPPPPNPPGRQ